MKNPKGLRRIIRESGKRRSTYGGIMAIYVLVAVWLVGGLGSPQIAAAGDPELDGVIVEIAAQRAARGLRPLVLHDTLMAEAQLHAEYLAAVDTLTHERGTRPRLSFHERIARAGYNFESCGWAGERIAFVPRGTWTPVELVDFWISDPKLAELGIYEILTRAEVWDLGVARHERYFVAIVGVSDGAACPRGGGGGRGWGKP